MLHDGFGDGLGVCRGCPFGQPRFDISVEIFVWVQLRE